MFAKIRIIIMLIIFGTAMFVAGLLAPANIREAVLAWIPGTIESTADAVNIQATDTREPSLSATAQQ